MVLLPHPYMYLPFTLSLHGVPQAAALLLQEFELPGIGSIGGFSGTRKSKEMFFSFTSESTAAAAASAIVAYG